LQGLALYHEGNWKEAATKFEKAREIDQSVDLERADIMKVKCYRKLAEEQEPEEAKSSTSQDMMGKRYGCEICGHVFNKKFNLDRHNRTIHKRETPEEVATEAPAKLKPEPVVENTCVTYVEPEPAPSKKKRSKHIPLNLVGHKNRVKCTYCKKLFKRGSLARHMVRRL
jgi:hypothetical protein